MAPQQPSFEERVHFSNSCGDCFVNSTVSRGQRRRETTFKGVLVWRRRADEERDDIFAFSSL